MPAFSKKCPAPSKTPTNFCTTSAKATGPTTRISVATLFKLTLRSLSRLSLSRLSLSRPAIEGVFAATAVIAALLLGAVAPAMAAAPQETLSDLIRAGNREAVLAAITSPDLDVNAPDPDGSTALLWATYKVDHELVRALLKAGAKANVTNNFGSTPLTEAVKLASRLFQEEAVFHSYVDPRRERLRDRSLAAA